MTDTQFQIYKRCQSLEDVEVAQQKKKESLSSMFLPGLFQAFFSAFSTLKLTGRAEIHQICTALILQPIVRASTLNGVDFRQ